MSTSAVSAAPGSSSGKSSSSVCCRGRGPLSRAGPRFAFLLLVERVSEEIDEEIEEASDEAREETEAWEEATDAKLAIDPALLLLSTDLDDVTLAVSLLSAPALFVLPLADNFFETLLAAARSTMSQMADSLTSVTHGCVPKKKWARKELVSTDQINNEM